MNPHNDYVPSSLITTVVASYNQMCSAFGFKPNVEDDYPKVHCSWVGESKSNKESLVAIWSWKEPIDPRDRPDDRVEWSAWYNDPAAYDELVRNL